MKMCIIAGAGPNFMKISPTIEAINAHNRRSERTIDHLLVHTGQHYDQAMSRLFLRSWSFPNPDTNLEVGSASHARQTADVMKKYGQVCLREKPTHTLVAMDANSTIA